jgi:rhodanese-related sulfurtransferase
MRNFSKYHLVGVFLLMTVSVAMAETMDWVTPGQAATMQNGNKAVILDVRNNDEWNEHHIHGAVHIPLAELKDRLPELEAYKNSPVITQCKSGKRSAQAQIALKSAGFTNVYNMDGGIIAWDKSGLVTE